jgi:hypothetical protein
VGWQLLHAWASISAIPGGHSDARAIVQSHKFKASDEQTLREQIDMAQIPAPPFKEPVRARD